MLPTLKIGQLVKIDSAAYATAAPAIGDIVAFHPPHGADLGNGVCANSRQGLGHPAACGAATPTRSTSTFIKRVVAGPGDKIFITDGHVTRNGTRENDPYITACGGYSGALCRFPRTIVIPPGDYFLLGDNRGVRRQPVLGTRPESLDAGEGVSLMCG